MIESDYIFKGKNTADNKNFGDFSQDIKLHKSRTYRPKYKRFSLSASIFVIYFKI